LLAVTLFQCAALAGSAAAAFANEKFLVSAFAACVGLGSTLFRPTLQPLLPSLARTCEGLIAPNGATSGYTSRSASPAADPADEAAVERIRPPFGPVGPNYSIRAKIDLDERALFSKQTGILSRFCTQLSWSQLI